MKKQHDPNSLPLIDPEQIKREAEEEFNAELHRELVEKHKAKIRARQNFWIRTFPWRIRLERRDEGIVSREVLLNRHLRALRKLGYRVTRSLGFGILVEETGGK